MITLRLTEHANIFLNTYPVVFSHLSLQPLLPCTRSQQCFTTATNRLFGHFEHLELPLSYCDVAFTQGKEQMVSTRCSGNNKEKLCTNIRKYASDFCHDRKSSLREINCGRDRQLVLAFEIKNLIKLVF